MRSVSRATRPRHVRAARDARHWHAPESGYGAVDAAGHCTGVATRPRLRWGATRTLRRRASPQARPLAPPIAAAAFRRCSAGRPSQDAAEPRRKDRTSMTLRRRRKASPRGLALALALPGLVAAVAGAQPALSQTLSEALAQAYANNPTLLAARAQLRTVDENVPQALAGWRPTVSISSSPGSPIDVRAVSSNSYDPIERRFYFQQPQNQTCSRLTVRSPSPCPPPCTSSAARSPTASPSPSRCSAAAAPWPPRAAPRTRCWRRARACCKPSSRSSSRPSRPTSTSSATRSCSASTSTTSRCSPSSSARPASASGWARSPARTWRRRRAAWPGRARTAPSPRATSRSAARPSSAWSARRRSASSRPSRCARPPAPRRRPG